MSVRSLLSCAFLASLVLSGQQTTGQPSAPTTGGGGGTTGGNTGAIPVPGGTTGGNNRNTSPFPTQTTPNPTLDTMQNRPIFLSGKVRLEDGSVPPEPATIERICSGRGNPVVEAYTDSKGGFGFQVGQRMGVFADASTSSDDDFGQRTGPGPMGGPNRNTITERDLMMCELRASLPGYRSTVVSLAGRRALDNPDVGIITLRRLVDVTGFTTSATSLMAPKDAKKSLEKARNALKKNKLPDAMKELELAVNTHPKYAEAWYEMGRIHTIQNNPEGAKASYQKALEADEKYVRPYLGLAMLEAQQNRWVEVKQITEKVIKLNRYDFPAAFFYGAVANYNLRDNETAEKLCRSGLEIDQYHSIPKMSHLLGMILADKADYKGASEQLAAYLKFAPKANDAEAVKKQLTEINGRVAQNNP